MSLSALNPLISHSTTTWDQQPQFQRLNCKDVICHCSHWSVFACDIHVFSLPHRVAIDVEFVKLQFRPLSPVAMSEEEKKRRLEAPTYLQRLLNEPKGKLEYNANETFMLQVFWEAPNINAVHDLLAGLQRYADATRRDTPCVPTYFFRISAAPVLLSLDFDGHAEAIGKAIPSELKHQCSLCLVFAHPLRPGTVCLLCVLQLPLQPPAVLESLAALHPGARRSTCGALRRSDGTQHA